MKTDFETWVMGVKLEIAGGALRVDDSEGFFIGDMTREDATRLISIIADLAVVPTTQIIDSLLDNVINETKF